MDKVERFLYILENIPLGNWKISTGAKKTYYSTFLPYNNMMEITIDSNGRCRVADIYLSEELIPLESIVMLAEKVAEHNHLKNKRILSEQTMSIIDKVLGD